MGESPYSTINGLKRLAKRIRHEHGLRHHEALDIAARRGGYENFIHASRSLPDHLETPGHLVTVRQLWRNRESRERGYASYSLPLSRPLTEYTKPHMLCGHLSGARVGPANEIWGCNTEESVIAAKKEVARLVRCLQFMDITGLRPSRSNRCYPKSDYPDSRPPIGDHEKSWYDPATRTHLLTVEAYLDRSARRSDSQTRWGDLHGYDTLDTGWGSIHGHGTRLFLIGKRGGTLDLTSLALRLEQAPSATRDEDVNDIVTYALPSGGAGATAGTGTTGKSVG